MWRVTEHAQDFEFHKALYQNVYPKTLQQTFEGALEEDQCQEGKCWWIDFFHENN
jgi:hypothetical protein